MQTTTSSIIALDVGGQRIGVAIATHDSRLPRPLMTFDNDSNVWQTLNQLVVQENVSDVVIGLPRGLDGQETAQTAISREFAAQASKYLKLPVHLQDEAVTSQKAREELEQSGKPFNKGDIDSLAASYILEDFLGQRGTHA